MLSSSIPIDLVFILSPSELHVSQSLLALKYGKHLFIEKPLANTLAEVDELEAAAEKSGKIVFVGYMRRYAGGVQLVKDRLKGKKIQYARIRELIGSVSPPPLHFPSTPFVTNIDDLESYIYESIGHVPSLPYRLAFLERTRNKEYPTDLDGNEFRDFVRERSKDSSILEYTYQPRFTRCKRHARDSGFTEGSRIRF
jgi:hypothetical protein